MGTGRGRWQRSVMALLGGVLGWLLLLAVLAQPAGASGQGAAVVPQPAVVTPDPVVAATVLPVGGEAYEIALDADGIYEISGAALAAAGMDLGSVDPHTLEMSYRGEAVAYELVNDDGDTVFDADEAVRFYGWAFDGSRHERQYFEENVFWLWPGGTPLAVGDAGNPAGHPLPAPNNFQAVITRERDLQYTHTRRDESWWAVFPNEADAWYWWVDRLAPGSTLTRTEVMTLPYPAGSGGPAEVTVELFSADDASTALHTVQLSVNGEVVTDAPFTWAGSRDVNVTATVPLTALHDGPNEVATTFSRASSGWSVYYLNRITVAYPRAFQAVGDEVAFRHEGGDYTYAIGNLSEGDAGRLLVWDIGERRQPRRVPLSAANVSGSGPYTCTFGSEASGPGAYLVTTVDNVHTPLAITRYDPPALDPAGGAAWLAISYGDFMPAAEQLAAHRQQAPFGGLSTQVVDVADVTKQYGYGLPLPGAIRAYLAHARATWPMPPAYVVLVGDATMNPRGIQCTNRAGWTDCDFWEETGEPNYVPTDLRFLDRFQGYVPTDYSMALLSGDDLVADVEIGRLPVESLAEAQAVVDKIIAYETARLVPEPWQRNVLFVSDNNDGLEDFCEQNTETSTRIATDVITKTFLCLPSGAAGDVQATRDQLFAYTNDIGASIVNYRGHGSAQYWTYDDLLDVGDAALWDNAGRPVVILSADCLDSNFVYPGLTALSETFLRLAGKGSVAHWSSTGLGFSFEHSLLHDAFYDAIYQEGMTVLGDAVGYAKATYAGTGYHVSELYTFVLQGDPAMRLFQPAQPEQVAATLAGPDVALAWAGEALNGPYRLYSDTVPYVDPDGDTAASVAPLAPGSTAYTIGAPNGVGDPANNYYFVLRAYNYFGVPAADSNRMGEFDFALVPGG